MQEQTCGRLARRLVATLVLVVAVTSALAASDDGNKVELIDTLMSRYHELRQFNGTVLVARGS